MRLSRDLLFSSELSAYRYAVTQMLHLVSHTTGIPTAALATSSDLDGRLVAIRTLARTKLIL